MNEQQQLMPREAHEPAVVDPYERLAAEFSRVYAETKDIATTLALLDARRSTDIVWRPVPDLPALVIRIAASLFYITPPSRLLRPGRHHDICAARWIAAWLLRRHRWTLLKIAGYLNLDHSTVIHGLRRVSGSDELRAIAGEAEARLEAAIVQNSLPRPANDTTVGPDRRVAR
jgi:Bacterial dnaA protein helix-turn-helix